jgi:hypothetical protein
MTDAFEERKKAFEEEYFHRKEKETLEKLRAKLAAEAEAANHPQCPKCEGKLVGVDFEGHHIDRCAQCGGFWLDKGELEALTRKDEGGFFSRLFG